MTIYVNGKVDITGDGSKNKPFQTIQEAAEVAQPGDQVLVSPGVYREYVRPRRGGNVNQPIVYRSAEPLAAVITGAEPLKFWEDLGDGIWKASVKNTIFGDFNPYRECVLGDWFMGGFVAHRGDVYLNHKSMYEVLHREDLREPEVSAASWDPKGSVYIWYAEVGEEETTFYCNFQEKDPNQEDVEISVRPACFAPEETGLNYITLSGFTVREAATQWAPPTAYQEGMIAPHWSKGWIIEDCEIYESKCSGISLGKYRQEGNDNKWLKWKYKDGTQTERECICQAQVEGWSKETVGSHIIRRCHIHDCGQTGIVGHLGGAFSVIEDCHIHHINNKQNLAGAEIGGIKMHAAIDCIYRRNHIHHCTRGIWLDWQVQGTRVTQNIFHDNTLAAFYEDPVAGSGCGDGNQNHAKVEAEDGNQTISKVDSTHGGKSKMTPEQRRQAIFTGIGEDIFVEISHGPTLIDNNILLSDRALKLACQGVAVCHNYIAGSLVSIGIGTDNGAKSLPSPRFTPYHMPHRTEVAGFMTCLHGDTRFYNNIFLQKPVRPIMAAYRKDKEEHPDGWDDGNVLVGTEPFDGYPSFSEWDDTFQGFCGLGSAPSDRYYSPLPVWSEGNVYLNGARAWEKETNPLVDPGHGFGLELRECETPMANVNRPGDCWRIVMNVAPEVKNEILKYAEERGEHSNDGMKGTIDLNAGDTGMMSSTQENAGDTGMMGSTQLNAECEENPFACYSARIGAGVISTANLGMAFEPEEKYENPDGSPLVLDTDILGKKRQGRVIPGPFAVL